VFPHTLFSLKNANEIRKNANEIRKNADNFEKIDN